MALSVFSNPNFGMQGLHEDEQPISQIAPTAYRQSADGELTIVASDIDQPNVLVFSPDKSRSCVVESRSIPS